MSDDDDGNNNNKNKNKNIQSSIDERIKISTIIDKNIKKYIDNENNYSNIQNCEQIYKKLFNDNWLEGFWGKPKILGKGGYGHVYQVTLKNLQSYPLALKKTNKMEITEAQNTILASSLVESGANPHFPILYAHLHCENIRKKNTYNNRIPWVQGLKQIRIIENKIKNNSDNSDNSDNITLKQKREFEKLIKEIEKNLYADDDSFLYFKKLKKEKEILMANNYGSLNTFNRNDTIFKFDVKLMNAINDMYMKILKNREKTHISYEIFLMELADKGFEKWILQGKYTDEQIISSSFQICSGLLSLVSFFKIVQNDLLLHNIMYNNVNSDVYYVYKIENTYFKVPLYGKLMKIIDFGLTTDVITFDKSYNDGSLNHWCQGGRGDGSPSVKQCSAFIRDILEYFYHMSFGDWSDNLRNWIEYAYNKAKYTEESTPEIAIKLFMAIFNPKILSKFNLPNNVIQASYKEFPINTKYQENIFHVTDTSMYKRKILNIIQNKISQT
jgi:hypothetical protein